MKRTVIVLAMLLFIFTGCTQTKYINIHTDGYNICPVCKSKTNIHKDNRYKIEKAAIIQDSINCYINLNVNNTIKQLPAFKIDSIVNIEIYVTEYKVGNTNCSLCQVKIDRAKHKKEADNLYTEGKYKEALEKAISIKYTPSWYNAAKYWSKFRKEYIQYIKQKKIVIGMNKEEAIAAWGKPDDINKTVGAWGVHEQWVYEGYNYHNNYLYFEDGILTSWQN